MTRNSLIIVIAALLCGQAHASVQSDILGLTSGARTKLTWVRFPWCDNNYNPIQAYRNDKSLDNTDPHTQLMFFDTDQGTERFLDSTIGSHVLPRFTRKNGNYVIWTDNVNKAAWIREVSGATPKRKLIDGGDFFVVACQWNQATGEEFVYVIGANGTSIYRIPLKADMTVDISQKTLIFSGQTVANAVSVSEDGKYLGGEMPWPACAIYDIAAKRQLPRRAEGAFGCEPNIAPDNSYRFFHLRDDHMIIRMWDANLSETNWDVIINDRMPGNHRSQDCVLPRWSNNVRFLTCGYPLLMHSFMRHWDPPSIFSMSAAQIRAEDPSTAGSFCIGKFSQDFRSIERWVRVTDGDIRRREVTGDAWIAGSSDRTPPPAPVLQASATSESKISLTWNAVTDNESGILEYNVYRGSAKIATLNATAYSDSGLVEQRDYSYQVSALNYAGVEGAKSAVATVRTLADRTPPSIAAVYALDAPTQATVVFSEKVEKSSAENTANYSITPAISISAAALNPDSTSVLLTLAPLSPGVAYTINVSSVRDRAQSSNTIAPGASMTFTYFACGDHFNDGAIGQIWKTITKGTGAGVIERNDTLLITYGSGNRIQSYWPDQNNFSGIYRTDLIGDFDVWVKVTATSPDMSNQGIIAANNIQDLSQGGFCAVSVDYAMFDPVYDLHAWGYSFYADRTAPWGIIDWHSMPGSGRRKLPSWLRLSRRGTSFSAYYSTVGPHAWVQQGETVDIPSSAGKNSQICIFAAPNGGMTPKPVAFDAFGCTQIVGGGSATGTGRQAVERRIIPVAAITQSGGIITVGGGAGAIRTIRVIAPDGRTVMSRHSNGERIVRCDLRTKGAGTYMLRIDGVFGTRIRRIVIGR